MNSSRRIAIRAGLLALLSISAGALHAQIPKAVEAVASENASLIAEQDTVAKDIRRASADLAEAVSNKRRLEDRIQRIEQRAEVQALGPELAEILVERLQQLPTPRVQAASRQARIREQIAASDATLQTEEALRELDDFDAAMAKRLGGLSPHEAAAAAGQMRSALTEQRNLLEGLLAQQRKMLAKLRELREAQALLDAKTVEAREKFTQLLYWLPAPPSTQTVGKLGPALRWTFLPTNWAEAGKTLLRELNRRPLLPALALALAGILLATRGRIQRAIGAWSPSALGFPRYRIGHTVAALAFTLLLALPVPLVLGAAAWLLQGADDAQGFTLALGDSLMASAKLLLALSAFTHLLDRGGAAVMHFDSNPEACAYAVRSLKRYTAFVIPVTFVAALNALSHAPWSNRESLGRTLFIAFMVGSAVLLINLFRSGSPLMRQLLGRGKRGLAAGLHPLWLAALLAIPLGLTGVAAAGYFVVAEFLWGRVMHSLFLVLAAVALYGLMALWVQQQRIRLARRHRAEEARAAAEAQEAEEGSEAAEIPLPRLDLAAIGEQTRALLDLLVTLLLLGSLWLLWHDALPLLSVAGDYALWSVTDKVAGMDVTRRLTVDHLALAVVVAIVTVVVVRNIGALLDITLLQRFEMKADATLAVKVITRYAIAALGVLAVTRFLGISWSDAQWLVAALGVGLGFGLQEIVANFVSGLIVLAERPVRIGDVVTVGDVTGTVSGIRARSTRIIDFDNKEVIIPNKSFITDRVVNWTLADQTTRLLLTVGVAYGSSIDQVQQALLAAVRSNPDVLESPSPSVFFVGFGDSALNFEVRAYVDAFDKRLRVRHELYRAIEAALGTINVEIPFPQRDLHIRSAAGLEGALRGGPAA